ncbi:unnamed protein product, partial [Symbiodinium sp. CCMP2456]
EGSAKDKHDKFIDEEVSLRHGKFISESRVQDFVYIPAKSTMDIAAKSSELFETILRHWNLQRPYLLIKFQSGFAHPKHMLDAEELKKIEDRHVGSEIWRYYMHFKKFVREQAKKEAEKKEAEKTRKTAEETAGGTAEQGMQEVQAQQEEETTNQNTAEDTTGGTAEQGMQEVQAQQEEETTNQNTAEDTTGGTTGHDKKKAEKEKIRERALELLNEFLYKSLSNLIDVIVRACVRNRCWIVVEGGPNGGLLLLKQAAERCNERPIILVVDSLKKKRYPYKEVRDFIQEHKDKLKVPTLTEMARGGDNKPEQVREQVRDIASSMAEEWDKKQKAGNTGRKTSIRSKKQP